MLYVLLLCFFQTTFPMKNMTINEFYSKMNNMKFSPKESREIINLISDILDKFYTFNEISSNPPQPDFDQNYFPKFNIQEALRNIDISNDITYYELYQIIFGIFVQLKDLHLDLDFNNTFTDLLLISPIVFHIKTIKNEPKIFGTLNKNFALSFFNNDTINIISKNIAVPIKLINNQNPFLFISNYCGNFLDTKSPH